MFTFIVIFLLTGQKVSAQLGGLFGGLGGLPQFPGLPQLPPLTLPQFPGIPSLAPSGGGTDPLSQMLGGLNSLFQGISQRPAPPSPTIPPLRPPAPPPPIPTPSIPSLPTPSEETSESEIFPTSLPESITFPTFPTLIPDRNIVLTAENIDSGQTSFLGVIPNEDYGIEDNIDSEPDFIEMLSRGDHWTTEGKRHGKDSKPDRNERSRINDGDTEDGDHSVIGRPPPLPGLVEFNERNVE